MAESQIPQSSKVSSVMLMRAQLQVETSTLIQKQTNEKKLNAKSIQYWLKFHLDKKREFCNFLVKNNYAELKIQ